MSSGKVRMQNGCPTRLATWYRLINSSSKDEALENFRFHNTTEIIFGKQTENGAGREAKKYSNRVLLHYGGDTIKKIGLCSRLKQSLEQQEITVFELGGVRPNPVLEKIYEGINICREEKIGFILAAGGGSVIDSAKAIALGVDYDGDVWDFFVAKAKPESALPLGVVLTIPAAGSEASVVTVITNEKTQLKKGFHSHLILPKFAILNPELTFTVDPFQTACGSADMMAHILERYFTNTPRADLTDRLCEGTLKTIILNTPLVLKNPDDYDSRAELLWASTLAHNGILGTGRIEDWASHKLGHELGAVYGVAHGQALAVIFPAWMKYVYKKNIRKFEQFACRVWDVDPFPGSADETALNGIRSLISFFRSIGLATSLEELGINSEKFEEMAQKELQWGPIGNFLKLGKKEVVEIFEIALKNKDQKDWRKNV
jgi:alcohol dehydrogenase YqhD (iron-dependent ADH family)